MKSIFPIVLSILICSLGGCKQQETSEEQRIADSLHLDSMTLKIGYLPTVESLPLLMAEKLGYFHGANIRLICYKAGMDLDTALLNKRVQCITTDLCRALLLNAKDADCKVIARTNGKLLLVTARNQRIRRAQNLVERTVAIARNEASDMILDMMLEHEGMEMDVVNRPQVNALDIRRKMLSYEEVDAALLPEPFALECVTQGDRVLMTSENLGIEINCLVASHQALMQFDKEFALMKQGYDKAVEYLKNNKPEWKDLYGITQTTADSLTIPAYTKFSAPREKDIEIAANWLKKRNLLHAKHSTIELTDETLLSK